MTLHSAITAGRPGRKTCGRQWCTIEHCFKSGSVNTNRKERKHENGYAVEKSPPGRGTHDRRSRAGSRSCPEPKGPKPAAGERNREQVSKTEDSAPLFPNA